MSAKSASRSVPAPRGVVKVSAAHTTYGRTNRAEATSGNARMRRFILTPEERVQGALGCRERFVEHIAAASHIPNHSRKDGIGVFGEWGQPARSVERRGGRGGGDRVDRHFARERRAAPRGAAGRAPATEECGARGAGGGG